MTGIGAKAGCLLAALVCATPLAWAGIPVHDAPAQALRAQQHRTGQTQLERQTAILRSLSGASNFGDVLQSMEAMHRTPSMAEIRAVLENLRQGGTGIAGVEDIRRRSRVPLAVTLPKEQVYAGEEARRRYDEMVRLRAYYQLRGEQSYELAERRRPALVGLKDALKGAQTTKEVLDLQTEVLIEAVLQLNEQNQLLATMIQMQAHLSLMEFIATMHPEFLE